jgi:hypothetical protein
MNLAFVAVAYSQPTFVRCGLQWFSRVHYFGNAVGPSATTHAYIALLPGRTGRALYHSNP